VLAGESLRCRQFHLVLKINKILPELVINWDQTGTDAVPGSQWTMDVEGAQVYSSLVQMTNDK
jgi:hypothetical protein